MKHVDFILFLDWCKHNRDRIHRLLKVSKVQKMQYRKKMYDMTVDREYEVLYINADGIKVVDTIYVGKNISGKDDYLVVCTNMVTDKEYNMALINRLVEMGGMRV